MTKQKNPIIGMAFVVTSQQEMIEELRAQLETKEQMIQDLQIDCKVKEEKYEKLESEHAEILRDSMAKIAKLNEELLCARDQEEYFSEEYKRVNQELLNLKKKAQRNGWRKWTPGTEYDIGRYGSIPLVDGMYHYSADSTYSFYDNATKRSIPMAGKYNINSVNTPYQLDVTERGKFLVEPWESMVKDGATLVAVRIHYTDDCILLDDFVLPEDENNQVLL